MRRNTDGTTKTEFTLGTGIQKVGIRTNSGKLELKHSTGSYSEPVLGWLSLTATTDFSTTAASTSTITMNTDKTATVKVGDALRYKLSGTYYYGRVSAITASLLTVEGVALTTGAGDLTELAWKRNGGVGFWGQLMFLGDPAYNTSTLRYFAKSTTSTLIASRLPSVGGLKFPASGNWWLVAVEITTAQDDSAASTQATLQVTNDGNNCLTTAKTIPDGTMINTGITINATYALFTKGVTLEMALTAASGGTPAHDAANLQVTFYFVQE